MKPFFSGVQKINKRERAYLLYCEGKKIREIAKELEVSDITIKRWKKKDAWVGQSREDRKEVQKSLFQKIEEPINESIISQMNSVNLISKMCEKRMDDLSKKDFFKHAEEIKEWSGILKTVSQVHKTIVPDFKEEHSEQIQEQLGRLIELQESNGSKPMETRPRSAQESS